jgi:transcriptional regulator
MDGQKLRELRKSSGKTLRQISYESGVTENTILSIESGQQQNSRMQTILAICSAIGCSITDIIDEQPVKH